MSGYNLSNIPRAAEHSLVGTSDMRTAVPSQSLFAPSTSVSFGLPPSVPAISSSPYVAAQQVTPNLYSNISFAPTQTTVPSVPHALSPTSRQAVLDLLRASLTPGDLTYLSAMLHSRVDPMNADPVHNDNHLSGPLDGVQVGSGAHGSSMTGERGVQAVPVGNYAVRSGAALPAVSTPQMGVSGHHHGAGQGDRVAGVLPHAVTPSVGVDIPDVEFIRTLGARGPPLGTALGAANVANVPHVFGAANVANVPPISSGAPTSYVPGPVGTSSPYSGVFGTGVQSMWNPFGSTPTPGGFAGVGLSSAAPAAATVGGGTGAPASAHPLASAPGAEAVNMGAAPSGVSAPHGREEVLGGAETWVREADAALLSVLPQAMSLAERAQQRPVYMVGNEGQHMVDNGVRGATTLPSHAVTPPTFSAPAYVAPVLPPTTTQHPFAMLAPSPGMKASLPHIPKWTMADVGKRDVEEFLDDVSMWCSVAKQELWQGCTLHIDPDGSLKRAFRQFILRLGQAGRSDVGEVRRVFRMLVGDSLFCAAREAKNKIISDRITQGSRTVAAYAVHFRAHASQTDLDQATLCEKFIKGLEPSLARVCRRMHDGTYWSDLEACVAFAVGQSVRGGASVGGKSVPTLAASFPRKSGKSGKRHFNRSPPGPKPFPPPPPYQVGGKRSGPELGDFNRPAKRHNRNNHNNRTRDRLRCFKCGSTEHLADQCKNNK